MQEQDGDNEPAHHARRPMNAFLIFCKRHRSVVRDKYPNLENRSITKILGEWWANLEKEEKASYTGLAKQYKDAFFNANPDFKWYKLPAPPLRTLASRPRDADKPADPPHDEPEKTNNNSTKVDFNKNTSLNHTQIERKTLSMFTPGKLADEAHMGGLSSLLATKTDPQIPNPYYSPFNAISTPNLLSCHAFEMAKSKNPSEKNIRELQDALSETSKMFEDEFEDKHKMNPNDPFTNQDVIDQIVDKRYSKDDDSKNWSDDDKKSGRSCKGKRYQEFMAVGGLIVTKRQKRDYNDKTPDEDYATYGWEPGTSYSEDSLVTDDSKQSTSHETSAEHEHHHETLDAAETDNNSNKTYKPADFDLDAKIRALPSLSLEKFQQKKRENKRRKKSLKPKTFDSSQIINSVPYYDDRRSLAASWRETMTGSQKRKPRKISITRLEINSMAPSDDGRRVSPEMKFATEAPRSVQPADLLALATLAEVAASTSRIDERGYLAASTPRGHDHGHDHGHLAASTSRVAEHDYLAAERADEHASTV